MVNADRIAEVYKGEIWDAAPRERARRRIDWLVSHARGRVLDVGCSQGIATVLAARRREVGMVVGVDVELDRLTYAVSERDAEPDEVAACIAFVGASGTALPFADDSFDTVLLGEVLEHLPKPGEVLAEVARVATRDATIAITVPFGLSPHHDHCDTFYPATLLGLVAEHLAPTRIDLVDRYLRVIATPDRASAEDIARLLVGVQPTADRVLLDVERAELDGRTQLGELRRRNVTLASRSKQLAQTERDLASAQRELDRARRRIATSASRRDELVRQRDHYRWRYDRLHQRRSVRLLTAIRAAVSDRRALLALPAAIAGIVFGRQQLAPPPPSLTQTTPAPLPSPSAIEPGAVTPAASPSATAPASPSTLAAPAGAPSTVSPTAASVPSATSVTGPSAPATSRHLSAFDLQMRLLAPTPPVALGDLRVAAVLDEFSEASFGPDCRLTTFRPDNWEAVLTQQPPHVLFVESAWKATGGAWQYQVGTYHHAASVGLPHLRALIEWCRHRKIPTVFWNKEDPVHFGKFSQAAELFDVVLTTDANCVHRYRSLDRLRAHTVAALPFAAQPALHHPIALEPREPRCAFGGTYYRTRHPQRRAQLETLLDAAARRGLVIFDRTYGQDTDGVGFPDRFAPHISGGLPYEQMVDAYRRYRVFLNANSVVDSPTMFSRRVFELLACGTPVVSTPGAGMEELFGDIVSAVDTDEGADAAITLLLSDDAEWAERSAAGLRRVHGQHTYAHRLSEIAAHAGYSLPAYGDERIAVLVLDDGRLSAGGIDALVAQSHHPHELLIGASAGRSGTYGNDDVRVVPQRDNVPRHERLAQLARTTDAPWVLIADADRPMDLDDLADRAVARRWTTADAIGTLRATSPRATSPRATLADAPLPTGTAGAGQAHRYVDQIDPTNALVRRDLVARHGWDDRHIDHQRRFHALGASSYAVPSRLEPR